MKLDFLGEICGKKDLKNTKKRLIFKDENSQNSQDEIRVITTKDDEISKQYFSYLSDIKEISFKLNGIYLDIDILNNFKENDIIEIFPFNEKLLIKKIFRSDSEDNILFLTNKCNSNCIFCPDSDELRKNQKEYIAENIELLKLLPKTIKHIGITGGEPTILKENFFRILNECKTILPNTSYTVISNGRMFFYKDFCEDYIRNRPVNTKVAIALHGYNSFSHDYITQVDNSFIQTTTGIKNLLALGERIEIRIVLNKVNCDYLEKMANLIVKNFRSVEEVNILSLELLGNAAKNYEKFWIEKKEINETLEKVLPIFMKNKIKVNLYNFPLCLLNSEFWNITRKSITDYKSKYGNNCKECKVFDKCDGFFSSTFNIIKPELSPIK